MAISPWSVAAEVPSPDGRLVARIESAWEIAMGAPTSGRLVVSNGISRENCNPSMVWSDDSEFLAVPEWTRDRMQRLVVIAVQRRTARYAPGEYRVLQLESFAGGIIRGTDSPIHHPRRIEVAVRDLPWDQAARP